MFKFTSRHIIRNSLTIFFLTLILIPSQSFASDVVVRVLGVPKYEKAMEDLRNSGYRVTRYGPAGRPANGFQVISIGSSVPVADAIKVIRLVKRRLRKMNRIVLNSDRSNSSSKKNEITIGGTNSIMDGFPMSSPLSNRKFNKLLRMGLKRNDRFYALVRETYITSDAKNCATEQKSYIREDGVFVVPNQDGSASLYSQTGRRGTLLKNGEEMWISFSNLMTVKPVKEGGLVNGEWIDELNIWLNSLNKEMLKGIEVVLNDDKSMTNYNVNEKENTKSLYEKLDMRHKYLSIIIDKKYGNN